MLFAVHFLEQANKLLNKNIRGFSPTVEAIFKSYGWPGNLRELKNVVKRAALLSDGDIVQDRHLPFEISNFNKLQFDPSEEKEMQAPMQVVPEPVKSGNEHKGTDHSLKVASIDHEYEVIVKTLKENNFNKSKAAKSLNIDRKTLYNKIALYQELVQKKSQHNE
jgi:two-component system response regulator HydG